VSTLTETAAGYLGHQNVTLINHADNISVSAPPVPIVSSAHTDYVPETCIHDMFANVTEHAAADAASVLGVATDMPAGTGNAKLTLPEVRIV